MGATRTATKQDNRRPNLHTSGLPESIALAIILAGSKLATLHVPQNARLSGNGNVTFTGRIKGWKLPGEDRTAVLTALSFAVNGDAAKVSQHGVHASSEGNPTVCHTAVVELPKAGGQPVRTMVQVWATFSNAKGSYVLSVQTTPVTLGTPGPQVVGEIEGDLDLG